MLIGDGCEELVAIELLMDVVYGAKLSGIVTLVSKKSGDSLSGVPSGLFQFTSWVTCAQV